MVGSSAWYSLTSRSGASRAKISWYCGPSPLAISSLGKTDSSARSLSLWERAGVRGTALGGGTGLLLESAVRPLQRLGADCEQLPAVDDRAVVGRFDARQRALEARHHVARQ